MKSANSVLLCTCKQDGLYYIYIYNDNLLKQLLAKELFEGILHIYKYKNRFDILSVTLFCFKRAYSIYLQIFICYT